MWVRVVRHITGPCYDSLRYGRATSRALKELHRTDFASATELQELRRQRLALLLSHAAAHVPHYRTSFQAAGLRSPEDAADCARDADRFGAIPILKRDVLQAQGTELLADDRHRPARVSRTSGSTGNPTSVHVDVQALARHRAAKARAREWLGVRADDRWAMLWGRDEKRSILRSLIVELGENRRIFTIDELEEERQRVPTLRSLARFDPYLIYGFASGLNCLADVVRDNPDEGQRLKSLKAIISTAEVLPEAQRKKLQHCFGVPVADEYGLTEVQFIASSCGAGALHVAEENVYVEILNDGQPALPGEVGEIVVTDLHAYAAPIIRYVTGDMGRIVEEPCGCGRSHLRLDLKIGRKCEFVEIDGKLFHPEIFTLPHDFAYFEDIRRFRVIRFGEREFQIDVAVRDGAPFDAIAQSMRHSMMDVLGDGTQLKFHRVDHIPLEASGKLSFYQDKRDSLSGNGLSRPSVVVQEAGSPAPGRDGL